MQYPYKDQQKAKDELSLEDYILFSLGNGPVNSGVVNARDDDSIVVREINGTENRPARFSLASITLYFDTSWEDEDDDEDDGVYDSFIYQFKGFYVLDHKNHTFLPHDDVDSVRTAIRTLVEAGTGEDEIEIINAEGSVDARFSAQEFKKVFDKA